MDIATWSVIMAARRRIVALLDALLPAPPPGLAPLDAGAERLAALYARLRDEVEVLRAGLGAHVPEREVERVVLPLVMHLDERVLRRIAPAEQPVWPLLQRELYQFDYGGDRFYEYVEERLGRPDTTALVRGVLYFCLCDGFVGRYDGEPARIAEYKRRLAEQLPQPKLPEAPPPPVRKAVTAQPVPVWYYALAVAIALSLPLVFWSVSNW